MGDISPVAVLITVAVLGGLITWYLLQDQRRAARLRAAARELGLEYRGTDHAFHAAHLASGAAFSGGGTYLVKNLMVGEVNGRAVRVFDLNVISRSLVEQTVFGVRGDDVVDATADLATQRIGEWGYCFIPGALMSGPDIVGLVRSMTRPVGAGLGGMFEEESHDPDESGHSARPRLLHYLFAHRVLWSHVFEDPAFVATLMGADADSALGAVWRSLVTTVRADPASAAAKWRMPPEAADQLPTGLEAVGDEPRVVSRGDHPIGAFAVIRFAEPIESPEAAFAAVLTGEAMLGTARYFLWELTAPEAGAGGPAALLCEWLHDGTRRNHGRSGNAASEADFVAAVKAQLDTEQERRRAGAPAVHAPARRPGETRDPVDFLIAEAEGAAFRHQHCLMAFDVLPASAKADERAWRHAIEASDFTSLLSNLWRQAGEQAAEHGRRADLPAEGLAADAARIAGAACAMVTLPKPFSPPEAYFVAVFPRGLGSGSADDDRSPVAYTLEMTDPLGRTPPVVGRVGADGVHALVGDCDAPTRPAFERALTSVAAGESLPQAGTTLRQLLLYAQIGADRRS